jgi:hypothetical protein
LPSPHLIGLEFDHAFWIFWIRLWQPMPLLLPTVVSLLLPPYLFLSIWSSFFGRIQKMSPACNYLWQIYSLLVALVLATQATFCTPFAVQVRFAPLHSNQVPLTFNLQFLLMKTSTWWIRYAFKLELIFKLIRMP